jgi:hypothetical protein
MKTALSLLPLVLASTVAQGNTLFEAYLDGASEEPPIATPGLGYVFAEYDPTARTLLLDVEFDGLIGTTTVAHIHGPTAAAGSGLASVMTTTPTFVGFPAGVTFGTYDAVLDLSLASSYRAGFLSGFGGDTLLAEAALIGAMEDGKAYFNIHSTLAPGGEIRGFFKVVPEPGTWVAMISLGAVGAVAVVRRFRGGR